EARRRNAVLAEHRAETKDEARLAKLLEREIERDAAGRRHGLLQIAIVLAHAVQHPLAHFEDEVGFFGERNELRRRNVAVPRQAPAQQRLGADDASVAQVDLRLVMHEELVALERAA